MATHVEKMSQISEIKEDKRHVRKYLFFTVPPELWIGDYLTEGHSAILDDSSRKKEEVTVAGFISFIDELDIDGTGSSTLEIKPTDPTPVIAFVKSLS